MLFPSCVCASVITMFSSGAASSWARRDEGMEMFTPKVSRVAACSPLDSSSATDPADTASSSTPAELISSSPTSDNAESLASLSSTRAPANAVDECPICLMAARMVTLACGHQLCHSCLCRYVELLPSDVVDVLCPICRQALRASDLPSDVRSQGPPQRPPPPMPWTNCRILKWSLVVFFMTAAPIAVVLGAAFLDPADEHNSQG